MVHSLKMPVIVAVLILLFSLSLGCAKPVKEKRWWDDYSPCNKFNEEVINHEDNHKRN